LCPKVIDWLALEDDEEEVENREYEDDGHGDVYYGTRDAGYTNSKEEDGTEERMSRVVKV
jgi:hypothetical protein